MNKDRDKILFEADADTNSIGPYCEHYDQTSLRVAVGSEFCKGCPMCYGHKIRYWESNSGSKISYNGYVKCAADNRTLLNRVKCWLWRLFGSKSNVKYF
jgi:hypothetical protein